MHNQRLDKKIEAWLCEHVNDLIYGRNSILEGLSWCRVGIGQE